VKPLKKKAQTIREDYVQKMRDNYLLIMLTIMHDLVVSIDKDGKFNFVNDAAVEFWGKPRKKILGTHFTNYLHLEDVKKAVFTLQSLIENRNQVKGFMLRVKSPKGFRTVAWNGVAVFDESGDYVGAQATGKDLTDIIRKEEELKQSKQHLDTLLEIMEEPVVIIEMNGNIVEISQSVEETLGFSKEELVGRSFLNTHATTVESKTILAKNLEKLKKGLFVEPHRIEAVTKDGKKKLFQLSTARIIYKDKPAILGIFHDITDQKQVEKKLQESEERFKYFLDNAPEAIWVQDIAGTFLDGNKKAEELTGYKKEELLGKNMLGILVPPESVPALMEAFKPNMHGEISGLHELELMKKDGTLVFVEASTIPVERDGKIEIIGITRDITDRKNVEQKLRESEERYRRQFEETMDAIFLVNAKTGIIVDCNRAATKLVDRTKSEIIGKNSQILHPPESNDEVGRAFRQRVKENKGDILEAPIITKSGEIRTAAITANIIELGDKKVVQAIFRDVTEHKKIELKLQDSLGKFKTIFEGATDGIAAIDPKTMKFVLANSRIVKITGAPLEELLKSTILDYVPKDEIPLTVERFQKQLAGKLQMVRNQTILRKDKTRIYVDISAQFMNIENQQYIVAFLKDVTEQKKAQDALQDSAKRFRELSELLPEIVFEMDLAGRLTFVNNVAFERFGYSQNDFDKGLTAFQMLIEKDRNRAKKVITKILTGTDVGFIEYTALKKDGSTFPIIIHATPIISGNRPAGSRGLIVDITDRKKAEELLKKSEERFRSTLESMMEGCQIVDYNWHYLYVNDAAAKHGRLVKKDFLGKTIMDVYPGIEKSELFSVFTRCMKKRVSASIENEFTFSTGENAWFKLSIEPVPEGLFILSIDISDRKEVEEALRQDRDMLENITGNINAGLVVVSKDYVVLWANAVLKKYLGEIEGKQCYSSLNQLEDVCHGCGVKEVFETGKDWVIHEQLVQTPDGQDIWLEVNATAIRDEHGKIVAASEMSVDITARKKMENELKESLLKFRTIFEGATDGILAADPETRKFAFGNPRIYEILGYSFDELPKLTVVDIIPKEDLAFALEQFQKQIERKISISRNIPILRKDKTVIYCDISSRLMKIGNQQFLIGFFRDVTEQKRVQEALLDSEEKYRAIINTMNDSVWVIDFDGKFIDVNDAAGKNLGYSREELLSMGILDIDDALTPEQINGLIESVKKNKKLVFETAHKTKDGKKIPIEISTGLIKYQQKPAILSIDRDITERKRAQLAIDAAMHQLEQSNKELESYTYVVSHDLKAPLRTIRSFGSFILEDYAQRLDETGKDYLNRMINAASHMDTLIEDLLVLSRVGRKYTEFEQTDLNKILEEIQLDLEMTIKEHNTTIVVDKLPVLLVQRVWMKQLFMNLISNALKFNESKTPKIEVLYQENENEHLFKVRDNGIGIEEKYQTIIFDLFERAPTEKKYEGTGAGLSICKKIVEQLGGKIWVESTPGKGSTFMFNIPKEKKKSGEE
jgi:PAS domain S-box-containing protein